MPGMRSFVPLLKFLCSSDNLRLSNKLGSPSIPSSVYPSTPTAIKTSKPNFVLYAAGAAYGLAVVKKCVKLLIFVVKVASHAYVQISPTMAKNKSDICRGCQGTLQFYFEGLFFTLKSALDRLTPREAYQMNSMKSKYKFPFWEPGWSSTGSQEPGSWPGVRDLPGNHRWSILFGALLSEWKPVDSVCKLCEKDEDASLYIWSWCPALAGTKLGLVVCSAIAEIDCVYRFFNLHPAKELRVTNEGFLQESYSWHLLGR